MIEFAFKKESKLSNYYEKAPLVLPNGLRFLNSEAAYHSQKFADMPWKRKFCTLSPHESKVLAWDNIELWKKDFLDDAVSYSAMQEVVRCKFEQNQDCMDYLLSIHDLRIVEDTTGWHDMRWGRCSCPKCFGQTYTNFLGRILTDLRDEKRKLLSQNRSPLAINQSLLE